MQRAIVPYIPISNRRIPSRLRSQRRAVRDLQMQTCTMPGFVNNNGLTTNAFIPRFRNRRRVPRNTFRARFNNAMRRRINRRVGMTMPFNRAQSRKNLTARDTPMNYNTVFQQREFIYDVHAGMNYIKLLPGSSGALCLDSVAQIFNQYALGHGKFEFRSDCTQNTEGSYVIGIDYSGKLPADRNGVQSLEYSISNNVYRPQNVVIDCNKAMKNKWHITYKHGETDKSTPEIACTLCIFMPEELASKGVLGRVFIDYRIFLAGANPSASLLSKILNQATVSNRFIPVDDAPQHAPPDLQEQNDPNSSVALTIVEKNAEDPEENAVVDGYQFSGLEVSDTLTMATLPYQDSLGRVMAVQPKVRFRYSDGTPVETGAIVPLSSAKVLNKSHLVVKTFSETTAFAAANQDALHAGYEVDIIAEVFSVAKRLLKDIPIVGEIVKVLSPDEDYFADAVGDEPVEIPNVITAAATGDTIDITIPDSIDNTLTDFEAFPFEVYVDYYNQDQTKPVYVISDTDKTALSTRMWFYVGDKFAKPGGQIVFPDGFPATPITYYVYFQLEGKPFKQGDMFTITSSIDVVTKPLALNPVKWNALPVVENKYFRLMASATGSHIIIATRAAEEEAANQVYVTFAPSTVLPALATEFMLIHVHVSRLSATDRAPVIPVPDTYKTSRTAKFR